ncbi:hypothetical protein GCM10022198_15540 [Klugiella xanthotipulae]|uniref:Putative flippase GtrA n=1 Tax=Klugiella xanthotipulae TaxID=244735 RepID=A0A543HGZ2_9MICO|nr:GtrA family protein [Klugiella xanthotipulae]TQM57590.1 putative flippase GtrA [Klugiella xanthotipulae]
MTMPRAADRTLGQVIRFLIVGGSNTLITYAIFIGLGLVIPPWIAYSIAFGVGLVWVTLGSSRIVFRARAGGAQLALFCAWYLVVFGVGQLVIRLIDPRGFVSLAVTSLIVLACTTPLTFLGGRYIFRQREPQQVANEERES